MDTNKIRGYIKYWTRRGYPIDIPDEVPIELMHECLAPSYKAIAIAILKNDHALKSLGIQPENSAWYSVLKRIEIAARPTRKPNEIQLELF